MASSGSADGVVDSAIASATPVDIDRLHETDLHLWCSYMRQYMEMIDNYDDVYAAGLCRTDRHPLPRTPPPWKQWLAGCADIHA